MKYLSCLALCAMCAAMNPVAAAEPTTARDVAPLRVYDVGSIAPDRYTVIKRLWVESWRTAFDVPAYADSGSAIRELLEEATRLGADGVVNLHCLNTSGWNGGDAGSYFCYGNAIKVK